jgi:Amt family ammonium transporter
MLVSTAFVLVMTPGLALFYGGMTRRKNVLGTMMQSWILMGLVSVQWALIGYSLAFGKGSSYVGGTEFAFLPWAKMNGQTPYGYADTIPHLVFMAYQMMFAIITPALIFGSVAERMKFKAMVLFALLWSLVVYNPLAHMVWGTGGLFHGVFDANGKSTDPGALFPALDFAGGTVVHISSGIAALVACLMMGKRHNYNKEPMPPHSLVLSVIGAGLLWMGWFGFNGGSALHANGVAASALVATHLAAAAATLSWLTAEWAHRDHPSMLGGISGAVAGLVVITPAAGFVSPMSALIMGLLAGGICYCAVALVKAKLNYDDSLDAFGVHGVGGITGAILTGVFCSREVNGDGANGMLAGNAGQLTNQVAAVALTIVLSGIGSFVLLKIVDALVGLRVETQEEVEGLDLTQHGETGYNM